MRAWLSDCACVQVLGIIRATKLSMEVANSVVFKVADERENRQRTVNRIM